MSYSWNSTSYWTPLLITVFTGHWFVFCSRWIQSTPFHQSFQLLDQVSVCISHIFHACYITFPYHVPWFNHPKSISSTQYGHKKQIPSSQTNWQPLKLSDNSYWAGIKIVNSLSWKLIGLKKEKAHLNIDIEKIHTYTCSFYSARNL